MFKVFCSRTGIPKNISSNEFHCWFYRNYFSFSFFNRTNLMYSFSLGVNHFNSSQGFLKENLENIENFNPSKMIIKKDGSVKIKKKPVGVKVYLLNERGISSSMYFQEAQKLAQRQKLELKKVDDINGVAAYKLVPISDLLEIEVQSTKDEKKKEEKMKKLMISADINPNDLHIKINHINKFLHKGMKVFIKLGERGSETSKLNAIYSELEKSVGNHSISKLISKSGYFINIVPQQKDSDSDQNKN